MIITLEQQLASVRREIAMRERVYPKWVAAKKMRPETAEFELAAMKAVHRTLETVLQGAGAADTARIDWCERSWPDGLHIEACGKGNGDHRFPDKACTVFIGPREYRGAEIRAVIDAAMAGRPKPCGPLGSEPEDKHTGHDTKEPPPSCGASIETSEREAR